MITRSSISEAGAYLTFQQMSVDQMAEYKILRVQNVYSICLFIYFCAKCQTLIDVPGGRVHPGGLSCVR